MKTAEQTKIKINYPQMEVASIEILKIPKGYKSGCSVLYLAKRVGRGKDDKWMKIWHKGREFNLNDVLTCSLVLEVDSEGHDYYRIWNIQTIYPRKN